jgi:hypothetical protein
MDGPSIYIWHAAISQYPQVFSAINLSQKADEAENVPALSVALSLYLRAPSSSMSGLYCGPFPNEPHHPHECVCGVSFFFTPNQYLSQNAGGQDDVLLYKDSTIYFLECIELLLWHPSSFSGILCLKIISWICLCLCFLICALKYGP